MTAQDLGAIASEGTLKRIAIALEGMSSGGGGSASKLYRHDIKITIDSYYGDGSAYLAVYRTTAEALTMNDISDEEFAAAKFVEDLYLLDSPGDEYAMPVYYIPIGLKKDSKNEGKFRFHYMNELGANGSPPTMHTADRLIECNLTDTVTEV